MKTAKEFRDFFAGIPDEKWSNECVLWERNGRCCAYGLLGVRSSVPISSIPDAVAFKALTPAGAQSWTFISDGVNLKYRQPTAKARILAALDEIIAKES